MIRSHSMVERFIAFLIINNRSISVCKIIVFFQMIAIQLVLLQVIQNYLGLSRFGEIWEGNSTYSS